MKLSSFSATTTGRIMQIANTLQRWRAGFSAWSTRLGGALAVAGMFGMLTVAPAKAQIQNGGFEAKISTTGR